MDQPPVELLTWLAQHQPLLYGGLLVLAFLHRKLSVMVGQRNRPVPGEPWYGWWMFAGRLSGAVWKDDPAASVKTIFGKMPAPAPVAALNGGVTMVQTTEGAVPELIPPARSGDTLKQWTGPQRRIDPPPKGPGSKVAGVVILGFLFAFASGCAPLTAGKKVVNQGLVSNVALVDELTKFSVTTEHEITLTSRSQEEAARRSKDLRAAVDFSFKLLERSGQNLKDVAKALGVKPPPAPVAAVVTP